MATLLDVAKRANVSKMTVSRVVNHPEKVSDELKQLVHEAMQELDYVPNYVARALVQNKTRVIKLLILEEMDAVEPYYMNLLTGISRELDKHHYSLQLVTRNSHDIGICDGIIITGMRGTDYELIKNIGLPTILFGENEHGFDFIDVNNKLGASLATEHLLGLGYDRIIFLGIDVEESFEEQREEGYQEIMERAGKEGRIIRVKNSSHAAERRILSLLETREKIGIVCASDRIAFGVIRGIQRMGKCIPSQFAVTGFDGVFLDRISSPHITTVRQPVIEMGEACAQILLKKIDDGNKPQGNRYFEPELLIRNSTVVS